MIKARKVIGVCLSRIEDDFRVNFVSNLHLNAIENDYKLIVFNSLRDFYNDTDHDKGSASIFESINYDLLDAVVILDETIHNKSISGNIISKAKEHNIPVVLIHGEHPDCYSIVSEYEDAYLSIIRHVITEHCIKRPVFIGGLRDNDPETRKRLGCFKKVLEENNIPFSEDMVYYGSYWEVPTRQAVKSILTENRRSPDAVICANDTMAMTVCEELELRGYKVPRDMIVTGFDGITSAEYFMPQLTTCREDVPGLAEMTVDIINGALAGTMEKGVFIEKYLPYISESCGCGDDTRINYRERARFMYKRIQDMLRHEGHIYSWVDTVLDSDNINTLGVALNNYILPHSSVCLREDFIMTTLGKKTAGGSELLNKEMIIISSKAEDSSSGKQGRFPASDMIPELDSWLNDETMCVLTPIYEGCQVCGYYSIKTDDIHSTAHKLFRVSKTMNISFGSLMSRLSRNSIQTSMQNLKYTDQLTGLPNLKGLNKWFSEFSADEENHNKTIMVSEYNIPQYKFIYENYGIDDIEEAIRFVADALSLANKDNGYIARSGNDEFTVVNYCDNQNEVPVIIDNAVSVFFGVIEGYNSSSSKDYFLEVNCGCTVADPGWNSSLQTLMKLANAEMYMNRLKAGLTPVMKEEKLPQPEKKKDPRELYSEFSILIEKNLFTYFFQPIIDAKTGEIYAYEALMRTTGGIRMSPLEILDIAKEYNMLYDIEKATMFNVMERYAKDSGLFDRAKVFINTIPGSFLNNEDLDRLKRKYGKYISNFVFEITEQDTVSDEELNAIRNLGDSENNDQSEQAVGGQIAVDDYGTGHSNIVNLLRYAPHIIKIDRFLISNIQNDPNKQMFVKSTIEFARINNIKVLAEGVETYEEMKTVIEYGVDLIQGYYTARPAPDPIGAIPENIRREVINENINLSRFDNSSLTYEAKDGEVIDLYSLTLEKYSSIHIVNGDVRLVGTKEYSVSLPIMTDKGSKVKLTLMNVSLKATDDGPAIQLGEGSNTEICLAGKNSIIKNGIHVPKDAFLKMTGGGSLEITVKRNGGAGIGSGFEEPFGSISFRQTGDIKVTATVDKVVAIGGGISSENSHISFRAGKTEVSSQCIDTLGIGSVNGNIPIYVFESASVKVRTAGSESVGIGSFGGEAVIRTTGIIDVVSDGEKTAAIGTLYAGSRTDAEINGGIVSAVVHGDTAACVGAVSGTADVFINDGNVTAYGEGDNVCGFGSAESSGKISIRGGCVSVEILSGNIMQFGSPECRAVITGGSVKAANPEKITVFNDFGEELHLEVSPDTSFAQEITTDGGKYIYRAESAGEGVPLYLYLP